MTNRSRPVTTCDKIKKTCSNGNGTMATLTGSYGHFTSGGSEERIESTLPPVRKPKMVPRS
jgi:hypothetical protein